MKKVTFLIVLLTLLFSWYGTAQITSYPYSEDFEAGNGGWEATNGANGSWALGTPSASIINSAASGTNAWATNLSGNYNASENSFVKSPVFDLSTLTAPSIEFSVWWNSEFSWDGMVLQSSIDSGTSWQVVGAFGDPNNWYTDTTISGNPGGQQLGWTGRADSTNGSGGWVIARHALTGLAGQSNVIFRFAFGSDGSVQDNGVAFDLVSIFEVSCPEPINLTVDSIVATTANLSWTAGGSQTEFEYINQTQGTPIPTNADSGTPISTNTISLTDLTEGGNYSFFVRTVCGNGEYSSWGGPLNYGISGPGETCGNPIMVTTPLPYTTTDDTANYFDDYSGSPGAACGSTFGYLNGDDVVYAYSPASDTSIDINLSNIGGNYAGIFVYTSCANIGVDCYAGATNSFSTSDLLIDNLTVTGGETYYIVISTWASPQNVSYTLTITENTCVDPVVTYSAVGDCQVAPQFFVQVDLTSMGSADSIVITDNQGNAAQTTAVTGQFSFGPYPNTTDVIITVANADDANCTLTSPTLTREFCQDFVVECAVGPETLNYCYDNNGQNDPVIFTFTSDDGNSLNLTFTAGQIENGWDELVIIDTDGSFIVAPTDNFYGAAGNLAGLTYQSTGDTISFYINSEGSGSCQSSSGYTPIDVSVSCATCTNPAATYTVRGECATAPQFFVDVDLTSLGSASSITLTDNQASTPQTVTTTGLVTFGPYPTATDVIITVTNDDDANCIRTSNTLTLPFCQDFVVNCAVGPATLDYCYENGGAANPVIFTFTSDDGNSLNLTFNAGRVENNWDELVVIDTDGSFIVAPTDNFYGAAGNLAGLTYQSTGDTISFYINSDGSNSCQSNNTYVPIDVSVSCATCTNPAATYTVRGDCLTAPQFFVDVDLTSLGSANTVTLTDNQGSAPQTVSATGLVTFGPYANATDVIITVANDDDPNCIRMSNSLTQPFCLENLVDCSVGPLTVSYCYPNSDTNVFSYVSSDGSPLNLTINSGEVEGLPWDFVTILDSDGTTVLYTGEGNNGDLAGLTFQSTGDTIYFKITSDTIISCASGTFTDGINYTVACATCINPVATYAVIDDCANGQQFLIDVNISSLGDAGSVTVTDNQGSAGVQVSATGVIQMGPYPFNTPVIITVSNDQDVNCVINSAPIQVAACPPANDNCSGAIIAAVNQGATCDLTTPGTILAGTPSGVPPSSCGGSPNDDVWFQFTALHEVELISLINISGGTTNLDHAVYSGSCGALTEVYCSQNASSVSPQLTVGTTYYLRVFSFGSTAETSNFDVCIQKAPENTICEQAANFCSNGTSSNSTNIPSLGSIACLYSTPNPSWNIIQIGEPGLVEIEITQTSSATGAGIDVDFVLWGPFDTDTDFCTLGLEVDCPSCPNNQSNPNFYPFGNIVDCSYSIFSVENATIANAQTGEIYLLLVTNYANQPGTITINQTNSGSGAGSTVADIQVNLGEDQSWCGVDSVILTANSPFADTFEWYADGFIIEGETGPTLTVTESNTYTVIAYDEQCDSFAQDEVTIILGLDPIANPVADIVTCDDTSGDDIEVFDLEAQTATILGGQDAALFNVTYHLSQSDAITGTDALTSPYTNISNPQTIWVRVEDANSSCIATTSFELIITGATPTATSVDISVCDTTSGNGVASFDLDNHSVNILNGQSATDFTVTYYANEADANAGFNELGSPYTNTSNPQTIWARVDNVLAVDCYAIVSFELIVGSNPVANQAPDLPGCDTDDNGFAEYNLTLNETAINGDEPNVSFTYYTSLADATAGTGFLGNPTDYESDLTTIFVRLVNDVTGCFSITSFDLVPGEVPTTTFSSDFNYAVCPNATTPINVTVTPQNYTAAEVTIVWYQDGVIISGQSGLTLPVVTAGTYTIEVTFNDTGCKFTVSQEVIKLDNCIIPQGISPDGDGKNDTFDLSNFNVQRIEIFNRLGTLVYSKDNYTNEWYGQTNNGDQLPVGTYFYSMIYEGGAKTKSSWVYINK